MNYTDEPVTGKQGRLLRALADGPKSSTQLIDIIYGDDPDGGPDIPRQAIGTIAFHLRKKLRPGWTIECRPRIYALVRS